MYNIEKTAWLLEWMLCRLDSIEEGYWVRECIKFTNV